MTQKKENKEMSDKRLSTPTIANTTGPQLRCMLILALEEAQKQKGKGNIVGAMMILARQLPVIQATRVSPHTTVDANTHALVGRVETELAGLHTEVFTSDFMGEPVRVHEICEWCEQNSDVFTGDFDFCIKRLQDSYTASHPEWLHSDSFARHGVLWYYYAALLGVYQYAEILWALVRCTTTASNEQIQQVEGLLEQWHKIAVACNA